MANYLAEVSEWLFGTTDCNSYNSILIHKLDSLKTRDANIPGSFQSFTPGIFWKFQSRDFFIPG